MNARTARRVWAAVVGLACGSTQAHAGTPVPTAYPQWIASFSRDYLIDDRLAESPGPTSLRMTDGDVVMVTVASDGLLLRRFAPDGSLRRTQVEALEESSTIIVKADLAADSVYVLTFGQWSPGALVRFGADLAREWSVDVTCQISCGGLFADLEVLGDGSAVVLRQGHLLHAGRDGHVDWVIDDVDDANDGMGIMATALAIGAGDTIWVAAQRHSNANLADTTVMRFDAHGVRLSEDHAPCGACAYNNAVDIDVLGDGSASVVGATGSRPSSFFAHYDATGTRTRIVVPSDVAITFGRVAHDDNGAIYVAPLFGEPVVRRIDPVTAAVLWTRDATDFAAQADGVLVTRQVEGMPGIGAVSFDASGNFRWGRTLSVADAAQIGHPLRNGASFDFTYKDATPAADPCSVYPQILTVDAKGALTSMPSPCRSQPGTAIYRSFDARADAGALVNLGYELAAYTPDGRIRWRARACEWCEVLDLSSTQWGTATLMADGSAWALERLRYQPQLPDGHSLIKRLDASGNETLAVAAGDQHGDVSQARLLAVGDDVIVLQPINGGGGITWQRVRADGSAFPARNYFIPDPDSFHIEDARVLDDGGVLLVTKGDYICSVGCSPHYVTLLSLNADGSLRWRYQFPESQAAVSLGNDGTVAAVLWSFPTGVVLRSIDATGVATQIELTELAAENPLQLAGPVNGHWLLRTEFSPTNTLWLIDAAGHVAASRVETLFLPIVDAWGAAGYLVETIGLAAAELIDPDTLATKAYFGFGAIPDLYPYGPAPWRLFDDGSIYTGIVFAPKEYDYHTDLVHFAVPGSAADDRLFANGFD